MAHKERTVPTIPEYKGAFSNPSYGTDEDSTVMFNIAGSILRRVKLNLADHTNQSVAMSKYITDNTELVSASKWSLGIVVALNMFLDPTDVMDKVLPSDTEPDQDELKNYATLLRDYDKGFFLDSKAWIAALKEDRGLKSFLVTLNVLLQEETSVVPTTEDKGKGYTDRMLCSLMDYLDVGNPLKTQVLMESNVSLTTKLGSLEYATIVEFGFTLRKFFQQHVGYVYIFIEDKRLFINAQNTVAQHMAKSLAFAYTNFSTEEPEDQEVFGICVRHHYFTFWRGIFPKEYLEKIRKTPTELGDAYSHVRCYPPSNFGLDICDPDDRRTIVRAILRIVKYVEKTFA